VRQCKKWLALVKVAYGNRAFSCAEPALKGNTNTCICPNGEAGKEGRENSNNEMQGATVLSEKLAAPDRTTEK
jgi:hypothetical protein